MKPALSCTIMAHPSRSARLPELVEALGDLNPSVVVDAGRTRVGNLHTALCAWNRWEGAYHLVVQDDALPFPRFPEAARAATKAAGGAAVAFWANPERGDYPGHHPTRIGELVTLSTEREWVPCVALALPGRLVRGLVEHALLCHPAAAYDDDVMRCYLDTMSIPLLACVPSIVAHDNQARSLLNPRKKRGPTLPKVAAPLEWRTR